LDTIDLRNCRRIFLRQFEIRVNIGVHEFEQREAQRLLLNVDLYVPLAESSSSTDDLSNVVDYDFIRRSILQRVERGHINLQETLCDDVLAMMLAHPKVIAAKVSTQKTDVYPDCAGVGVEVFSFRALASGTGIDDVAQATDSGFASSHDSAKANSVLADGTKSLSASDISSSSVSLQSRPVG
jgi:7,8-dihydroneopterin aldolase/epimerase/oxygenase